VILPFSVAGSESAADKRQQSAALQSGSAPVRYMICDRSGNNSAENRDP
jgi:hypothetical protein